MHEWIFKELMTGKIIPVVGNSISESSRVITIENTITGMKRPLLKSAYVLLKVKDFY